MSKSRCDCTPVLTSSQTDAGFKKALVIALVLNAIMFLVELSAGLRAGSASLLADSVDFLGDAGNYAISLLVLPLGLIWRSRAAFIKGSCMLAYGLFVLGQTVYLLWSSGLPHAPTMGAIGGLALAVNAGVAIMLYRFRKGDANQTSVWLCSRNDAIGNLAVLGAALLVSLVERRWPDLAVASIMAFLAIQSGATVLRAAYREMKSTSQERSNHRMNDKIRDHFNFELTQAKTQWNQGQSTEAWRHLERAHILSQAYAWPHTKVHLWMLWFALLRMDLREVLGQVVRVAVAAPGSWMGRAPLGNTGGVNVGILEPMPIPEDLQSILLKGK